LSTGAIYAVGKGLRREEFKDKVNTHWQLYRMVHNIEKLANSGG